MAYTVKWTSGADSSFESIVSFIEKEWTKREVERFIKRVNEKLLILSLYPDMFLVSNKRKHIHKTVLNKNVVLFYRQNKTAQQIELLLFWDTRRDPKTIQM